jgi:hypothetical protein
MRELVEKLVSLERDAALEKGDFTLFALFLREDSPDKWDLLAAADWMDANQRDGIGYLAEQLQSRFTAPELLTLSRIVYIAKDNPGLPAILQAVNVKHGSVEVKNCDFFGMEIKHAYLITSSAPKPIAASSS